MLAPREIAARVIAAQKDRHAIDPFTDAEPALSLDAAYAAQDLVVSDRVGNGQVVVGAKLGLTSRAKQVTMGVDEPLFGWLTSDMLCEPGVALPLERWIHPRVEPEIGFVIGQELRGPVSVVDVLASTAGVCAVLEIIDSRFANFRFRLPDVVADNASAAGYMVGPILRPQADLGDLSLLGCVLRKDGEVVATAAGAAVMAHPAAAVAWLVNRLVAAGRTLPAGSLVLSGALTDAVSIDPGRQVSAELAGLGTVEVFT